MFLKDWTVQTAKDILIRFPKKVGLFFVFIQEYFLFKSKNDERFTVYAKDIYPCLSDRVKNTPIDHHYIYHPAWAARILAKTKPDLHVDFSSKLYFSTMLSAFIPVKFYDYRPAELSLSNWQGGFADLCNLNIENNTYASISCLHTIEHIGLGRYGDAIDTKGDIKAINELKRITQTNGDILFVTPVGLPRIEFNAHRIYSYEQVTTMFEGCKLMEFTLLTDNYHFIENANPNLVQQQRYGCGCFWFKKL
jgi:hypothetical protein